MNQWQDEIVEIQTRLAFQEDAIAQLNDVIAKQDAEILSLKHQMMILAQRMKELQVNPSGDLLNTANERPPHY